jgi:hypothetical protein
VASNKEQSAPGKTEALRRESSMNVMIIVGDGNAVHWNVTINRQSLFYILADRRTGRSVNRLYSREDLWRRSRYEAMDTLQGNNKESNVSTQWDGTRKILLDADLDEMELIGTRTFSVAVAVEADPEFKTYIMAASSTHATGNRSIDNILRRNYDKWIQYFQNERRTHERDLVGLGE